LTALSIAGDLPKVGTKGDQVVKIVGPRGFKYAGDEWFLTSLGGQPDKFYGTSKVSALWI
jgi:hypothetical protein